MERSDPLTLTTSLFVCDTEDRSTVVTEGLDAGLTLETRRELLDILLLLSPAEPGVGGVLGDAEVAGLDSDEVLDEVLTDGLLEGSIFFITRELLEVLIVPEELEGLLVIEELTDLDVEDEDCVLEYLDGAFSTGAFDLEEEMRVFLLVLGAGLGAVLGAGLEAGFL